MVLDFLYKFCYMTHRMCLSVVFYIRERADIFTKKVEH